MLDGLLVGAKGEVGGGSEVIEPCYGVGARGGGGGWGLGVYHLGVLTTVEGGRPTLEDGHYADQVMRGGEGVVGAARLERVGRTVGAKICERARDQLRRKACVKVHAPLARAPHARRIISYFWS